jgi:predicted acetyltransferase
MPNLSQQEYRKRKQENKIEMLQFIEEWKQSGESQTTFCKNKKLSFHIFYYWLRRYKDQSRPATTRKAFIPVTIPVNEMTSSNEIEIYYPNGVRIVLPKNSDLSMVRTFINMV